MELTAIRLTALPTVEETVMTLMFLFSSTILLYSRFTFMCTRLFEAVTELDGDHAAECATSILIVVSVLAVAGRLTAHRMVQPRLLADDYCAIVALIISLGLCATLIACVKYGLGLHVVAAEMGDSIPPPQNLVNVFKTGYSMTVIAIPDLFFIKMSLLIFYRRVFAAPHRLFNIALYAIAGYVAAWTIAALVVFIYQCDPIYYFWDRAYALAGMQPPDSGSCLPSTSHQAAPAILSSLSDLLILGLPAIALWPLQMRKTRKIGLFFIFSLGAFVCGTSIVKIVYAFTVNNDTDSTYVNTELLLWTAVECCIGLVCACLPCMLPLLRICSRHPRATSKRRREDSERAVPMQNVNPPRFPGGRRLHSSEAVGDSLEDSHEVKYGVNSSDRSATAVPVGGEIIPWDRDGRYKNKTRNEAVGGYSDASEDVPPDTIKVESGWDIRSERNSKTLEQQ